MEDVEDMEEEYLQEVEYEMPSSDGADSDAEDPTWTPETEREYEEFGDDVDTDTRPRYYLYCSLSKAFFFFLHLFSLDCKGGIREEPKGIVFLSQLLLLFQHCHYCFSPKPDISVKQTGTMMTVSSYCRSCHETQIWKSQPYLFGLFPAGNLLLSFAVLCAGASVQKVLLVFQHMGLLVYHRATYYYHQKHLLFPTVVEFWRRHQAQIIDDLKDREVVLAGGGRHDSMGHSAKYCTYTIFCCTVGLIVHIVLVQVTKIFLPQRIFGKLVRYKQKSCFTVGK